MTDKKDKRTFSLNENSYDKTVDPNKLQEQKGNMMRLSGAINESEEKKEKEDPPEEKTIEDVLKEDEDISDAVEMFADGMRNVQAKLLNKEHQEKVAALCEPMSVLDILQKGEFRQVVPIVKGEFEVEFRSMSSEEDLAIKKFMGNLSGVSDRYFMDLMSMYQQAVCTLAINKKPLPTHLDDDGKLDKKALDTKLKYILSMPMQMTQAIGMHLYWFDLRVREMFSVERTIGELKNG